MCDFIYEQTKPLTDLGFVTFQFAYFCNYFVVLFVLTVTTCRCVLIYFCIPYSDRKLVEAITDEKPNTLPVRNQKNFVVKDAFKCCRNVSLGKLTNLKGTEIL